MKKITSLLLSAVMMFTVSAAVFAEEEVPERVTLTLDSAIEYALEHSLEIKKAEADLDKARYSQRDAKLAYDDYNSMGMSFDEALMESGYYYRAAQIQTTAAERALDSAKNNLAVEVKNSYMTALYDNIVIEVSKEKLENAKQKLEYADSQYAQGMISRLERKTFELALSSAQNELKGNERTAELTQLKLKNTINMPSDTIIALTGEFELPEITYLDSKAAKEMAKNQNAYLGICEGRELAELRFRIGKGWYAVNERGYSIENATYLSSMSGFLNSENSLWYNLETMYSSLETMKDSISVLAQTAELRRETAEAAFLQYQLGMITASDYVDAEQEYYNSRNMLLQNQLNYYVYAMQYIVQYNGSSDI